MTLSAEQLLTLAQQYWDTSKDFHLRQEMSPRAQARQALLSREHEHADRWWSLRDDLQRELPGFGLQLMGSAMDAGFRFIAYPLPTNPPRPRPWVLVGCVSLLAPVYAVYGVEYDEAEGRRSHFRARFELDLPGMEQPAQRIARKLEEVLGYEPLPEELARMPVPLFVEPQEPPHTTLFHALFTSEPASIP